VLLVALPTAPCAWISQGCPFEAGGLLAGHEAAPRSCCANHTAAAELANASQEQAPVKPAAPCTRDCCKVRALPPLVEKVVTDQPAMPLLATLVDTTVAPPTPWIALDREHHLLDPPLQILHCQWRL
jgi:hypothetical protein